MAHVLIMPRQGNTVESCVIVAWKVKQGDSVAADSPVCDVETDKATFEVASGVDGVILKLLYTEGDDVPVLEPIAVIGRSGEDWRSALAKADAASVGDTAPAAAVPATAPTSTLMATSTSAAPPQNSGQALLSASPRAKKLAREKAVDYSILDGSGPGGRIIERDIKEALATRPPLTAAAAELLRSGSTGLVDLPKTGEALGGRLSSAELAAATKQADYTDSPIKSVRKIIADRMRESLLSTAQFTLNASADASRLQALRARFKKAPEELGLAKITINDLILFLVSRLLPSFPYMNAHKYPDTLRHFKRVHLGMAVDTPRGLMVPVLRQADKLGLEAIAEEAKRLAAACQNGTITKEELNGSSFTVSNLGAYGVESFTPVLNTPEVAILGLCGIGLKPVKTDDGSVEFRPSIGLSLTIDHQAVDGATAARFLQALGRAVADIDLWLAK